MLSTAKNICYWISLATSMILENTATCLVKQRHVQMGRQIISVKNTSAEGRIGWELLRILSMYYLYFLKK